MNTKVIQPGQGAPRSSGRKPSGGGSSQPASGADIAKYAVAGLLVAAGVFAYYWFDGQWAPWMRIAAVITGLVLGTVVFMTSAKGPKLREFLHESRFELRKVVWPTRQEAMRMTWVVMAVVVIFSLILAAFDWGIASIVKLLLGGA